MIKSSAGESNYNQEMTLLPISKYGSEESGSQTKATLLPLKENKSISTETRN